MTKRPITNTTWQDFEKQLRTYVRSRVDPLWVDDIVGNILLRLVQHSDAFETADNPAAYVQRVANNAVTDYYRRKDVESNALASVKAEAGLATASAQTEEDTAHFALSKCMLPFIAQLPERYRVALTLTQIEQLSQKQAAERLGLSLSGLKSRVQRGRALLKRAVTRCCKIELDGRGNVIDFEQNASSCTKDC